MFSRFEWMVAMRYLRARRQEGFISVIAWFSLLGIGLGVLYGVAAEFRPAVTAGYGSAFGLGTATVLDEGVVPAVGLGQAPWQASASSNLYSYVSHLVFGWTAELVRHQVARTLHN